MPIPIAALALLPATLGAQSSFPKLEPVPFDQVQIRDRFWQPRQETNRTATVEHSLKMLEKYGNFLVMRLAGEGKREGYKGLLFTDSDLYKSLEGMAYTLATHPNPELDRKMDEVIALIAKAQMPDGYLNTWFQVTRPADRFKNLRDWHELYCAGHLFEAAVAHHRATGKKNLLAIATRFAHLIERRYGVSGAKGYCGHPEIELALVKLAQETGNRRYFDLSRKMVESRGTAFFAEEHSEPKERYDGTYWLDDMPILEHRDIKGHAVRAAYLLSGAADIARETESAELVRMLRRVWRSAVERRVFITGGIGPSAHNEGFTVDYDLPNRTAYQETCASIAMALWGHRMALLFGDAQYADAFERSLYNGVLSGIALDGKSFFYVNPLASMGGHHRQEWFQCACCPPNVLRTIASLGGYAYATSAEGIYVNLYVGGSMKAKVGSQPVAMKVETDYPWDGTATFTMGSPGNFALHLRIPGWCRGASVTVNGGKVAVPIVRGYFTIDRTWKAGDRVVMAMPMPVEQIAAHPLVKENVGRTAVQRGPLVYCLEQVDNAAPIEQLVVPAGTVFTAKFERGILGGVNVVEAVALKAGAIDWTRRLYQPSPELAKVRARWVPYGFWDNRAPGRMEVWIPTNPPVSKALGIESKAEVGLSFRSGNAEPWGINDGIEPESSGQQPSALFHFWPHKGGEEWAQYTWKEPIVVEGVSVYWFDDTGRGECRLPESWRLQALVAGAWQDVRLDGTPILRDKWSVAKCQPLATTALRLYVKQQNGWASGIHEWKVHVSDE